MRATPEQRLREDLPAGGRAADGPHPPLQPVVRLPAAVDLLAMAAAGALGAGVAILVAGGSLLLLVPAAVGGGLIGATFRGMAARRS